MNNANGIAAQILADIIAEEMGLVASGPDAQVFIRDQNMKIPNDTRIYVAVGLVNAPSIVANVTEMVQQTFGDPPETEQVQISKVVQREEIQVDIMSAGIG